MPARPRQLRQPPIRLTTRNLHSPPLLESPITFGFVGRPKAIYLTTIQSLCSFRAVSTPVGALFIESAQPRLPKSILKTVWVAESRVGAGRITVGGWASWAP